MGYAYNIALYKVAQGCRSLRRVLVSYVTFKKVSASTVTRWLRCVLELSGINTEILKRLIHIEQHLCQLHIIKVVV